jgi:hypothetical protein
VRWGIPERSPIPTSPSRRCATGPSLSALKGGEGIAAADLQFLLNPFNHPGEIAHYVAVPEADDAVPMPGDVACAGGVCLTLQCVLAAIELDCELAAGASEIDDLAADRMLPAKTVPAGEFAQSPPELLLNLSRIPAELPSDVRPPS